MMARSLSGEAYAQPRVFQPKKFTSVRKKDRWPGMFMGRDIGWPDEFSEDDIDLDLGGASDLFQCRLPSHIDDVPRHPPPNVYTWTSLLNGFLHFRRLSNAREGAERILAMMQEHGVVPNLVTWTVLVAGYARGQHVDTVIDTLQRLEALGWEPNEWTMKAFQELSPINQQLAIDKMDSMVKSRARREGTLNDDRPAEAARADNVPSNGEGIAVRDGEGGGWGRNSSWTAGAGHGYAHVDNPGANDLHPGQDTHRTRPLSLEGTFQRMGEGLKEVSDFVQAGAEGPWVELSVPPDQPVEKVADGDRVIPPYPAGRIELVPTIPQGMEATSKKPRKSKRKAWR